MATGFWIPPAWRLNSSPLSRRILAPREFPMSEPDDYDNPWKEALEHGFPEFMAFFFPAISAEIDWARGYVH